MSGFKAAGLLLSLVWYTAGTPAQSQGRNVRIQHQVSCSSCEIELQPIAVLQPTPAGESISRRSLVVRDSRGRLFGFTDNFQILVYDSTGRFQQVVGRSGSGPGEFSGFLGITRLLVDRADSLLVFHPPRISVFAPDLKFAYEISLPTATSPTTAYALRGGDLLLGTRFNTKELIGRAIHLVGRDGIVKRSLGPEDTVVPGALRTRGATAFKLDERRNLIWINDDYGFAGYSLTDNELMQHVSVVNVPWLKEDSRTSASVTFAGVDTAGRLWITGQVVRRAVPDQAFSEASREYVLEILDPSASQIVASQSVKAPMWLLADGATALSGELDEKEELVITVWKYTLVRRQ